MRPKVLIDCDGVMADFVKPVLVACSERLGRELNENDVTSWDIYDSIKLGAQHRAEVDALISAQGFCHKLEPYADAREHLDKIRKFADVRAVTAPWDGDYWLRERECWLVSQMGFHRHEIHQTHDKASVVGSALVDDKASTVDTWQRAHPEGFGIVFGRPWNVGASRRHAKANGWQHLEVMLRGRFGL